MKVTIKLKQGRCMTMKLWQWLIIRTPECGVKIAHRARSRENYVTTEKRAKKWRPLQPIISEMTTAIRSRTLTSTDIAVIKYSFAQADKYGQKLTR